MGSGLVRLGLPPSSSLRVSIMMPLQKAPVVGRNRTLTNVSSEVGGIFTLTSPRNFSMSDALTLATTVKVFFFG